MASRRDTRVADATTKLGRAIAGALRSWAEEVGADEIASDVMDRVREGFDVVRDRTAEAASNARSRGRKRAKKAGSAAKKATKKVRKNVRSTATRKTTRRTTTKKKTVLKKR